MAEDGVKQVLPFKIRQLKSAYVGLDRPGRISQRPVVRLEYGAESRAWRTNGYWKQYLTEKILNHHALLWLGLDDRLRLLFLYWRFAHQQISIGDSLEVRGALFR